MTKRAGGRPSKLTPVLQQKVCDAVRVGNGFDVAAAFAGIDKTTFHRWMKRGMRAKRGLYREFYLAVQKASSDAETRALAIVNKAAPEDWRAAAWFLERKSPERWGRRDRHEVEAKVESTQNPAPGVEELLETLQRLAGESPEPEVAPDGPVAQCGTRGDSGGSS
jgi:hypothetical protein